MTVMCTARKLGRLIEPGHRRVLFAVTRSNAPLETEHKLSESSMTRKTNTTMSGWTNMMFHTGDCQRINYANFLSSCRFILSRKLFNGNNIGTWTAGLPLKFRALHFESNNMVFHKLSTIQECQYCQRCVLVVSLEGNWTNEICNLGM